MPSPEHTLTAEVDAAINSVLNGIDTIRRYSARGLNVEPQLRSEPQHVEVVRNSQFRVMHSRQRVPSYSAGVSIAGGPMPSADEIRDAQQATWAGLSAGWETWDSVIMDQLGPVGPAIIERSTSLKVSIILTLPQGTGEPGLSRTPHGADRIGAIWR